MVQKNIIDINPTVLQWARTEYGYDISDISTILDIDEEVYRSWEETGSNIQFIILKKISKILKRQIAVFFLTETPPNSKKPHEYRNINLVGNDLSPKTLLAIRRANYFADTFLEIKGQEYFKNKYTWLEDFSKYFDSIETIATEKVSERFRNIVGINFSDQLACNNQFEAYRLWRNSIESSLGVLIHQLKMPVDEIQGFSLVEEIPYSIVVNTTLPPNSRLFTILHEFGHLLKHQSSLCYPEKITENQNIELECNTFAGKVMVPSKYLKYLDNADSIYEQAKKYHVSSEVYLRRLAEEGLINHSQFFELLEEIRSRTKKSDFIPRTTPLQSAMNSRGKLLFEAIFEAVYNNKISHRHAADVLGIKTYHVK